MAGMGLGGAGGDESPLAPEWACLEEPLIPAERAPTRVQYRVLILDFDSQPVNPTVIPGLEVSVCSNADCNPPMPTCPAGAAPTPTQQCVSVANRLPGVPPPLDEVLYQIDLPWRFENGSLRLAAPDYAEMNYIFGGPMIGAPEGGSVVFGLPIPLLKETARISAYQDVGVNSVDPTRGTLALRTLDCRRDPVQISGTVSSGWRAAGVQVEAVPEEPPAPAVAWSLSNDNIFSQDSLRTDPRGVAGFLNVDVGAILVQAIAPNDRIYPERPPALRVRANVITLAELRDGLQVWGQ